MSQNNTPNAFNINHAQLLQQLMSLNISTFVAMTSINFTTYNYDRTQQMQQAPNLLSTTDQLMDLTNQLGMSELLQQKSLLPLSIPFDVFQQPGFLNPFMNLPIPPMSLMTLLQQPLYGNLMPQIPFQNSNQMQLLLSLQQNQQRVLDQLFKPTEHYSNNQSNQTKNCQNRFCIHKAEKLHKIKSKRMDSNEYLHFCEKCLKLYQKNQFCDYCEQIASNKKEEQDDQEWIQCDICQKWVQNLQYIFKNHLNCEAKCGNKNILKEKEHSYYCLECRSMSKGTQKKIKKENLSSPEVVNRVESDSNYPDQATQSKPKTNRPPFRAVEDIWPIPDRSKDSAVTLTVTKENKSQLSFRLNLFDDEIKRDLEMLRETREQELIPKKTKPIQNNICSEVLTAKVGSMMESEKITKKDQPIPKDFQQSSTTDQVMSRPRRNVKVNYRSLVGEP